MDSTTLRKHLSIYEARRKELENSLKAVSLTLKISQREKTDLEKKLAEARERRDVLQAKNEVLKRNRATLQSIQAQVFQLESFFSGGRKRDLSTPSIFKMG